MQRIIIFEGPDRTGKTNIAQALSQEVQIPYFKNESESKNFLNPKQYYVNVLRYADPYFLSYLKQTKSSIIIDRHYPSEWVYSKVFKRTTDMKALERTDAAMAELGAKIIICWRESYLNREDDLFPDVIDADKLKQIHEAYIEFRNWTKCDSMWLNVDDEDLGREVDDALTLLDLKLKPLEFSGHVDFESDFDEIDEEEAVEESNDSDPTESTLFPNPDLDWSDVVWESEEAEEEST